MPNDTAIELTHSESTAHSGRNETLSNVSVTFRLPFRMTGVRGRSSWIGSGEVEVGMFVLDYKREVLCLCGQLYD